MQTRRLLSTLLIPLALLGACGDDDDPAVGSGDPTTTTETTTEEPAGEPDLVLTIDDDGTARTVAVGTVIDVELESCPSCGYSWEQMGDAGTGGLELVGTEDKDPTATEGQTGGTVTHVVRFEATAPGESSITLGYFPPAGDAPEEVFSVDLTITGDGDDEAAGGGASPFDDAADHTLRIEDSETPVTVAVGETIDVVLETCPSCGYRWEELPGNHTGALEQVGNETGPSDNEEGEVGGTVEHWFRFRAVEAGEDLIALGYFSPSAGSEEGAEEIFTVDVTITG